ncbi:regulator of G-protein signaling 7 [Copidosoma floridanum]|uniref:regulator of G-protein signaling 7 n=1 Tax=Copidosoma floridanum TaxID=29053 RepID=UPI0006C9C888|nr:regulator of G-protein signaling 7 [Copidosoma floridanum]
MVTAMSGEKSTSKPNAADTSTGSNAGDEGKIITEQQKTATGPKQQSEGPKIQLPPSLTFTAQAHPTPFAPAAQESPNYLAYKKMEAIIEKMQNEETGIPVKTVKTFMTKIPSIFTGTDLIAWMMKDMDIDDQEALHVAQLMAAHGYFFPIDDHSLAVKNDNTFYRFQTPYFWPSNCWEPENTDYAVYLCKRTMQHKARLELADYESEYLARLQRLFSRKWEFIFMQAEAQNKVDKKRDKLERKILDSQERAFWDVHRPMPGCVNTTERDIKKAYRNQSKSACEEPIYRRTITVFGGPAPSNRRTESRTCAELKKEIDHLRNRLDRRVIKVSKVADALIGYFEQYAEYDAFLTIPEYPNPWTSDSTEMWEQDNLPKEVSARRVKRWAFSLQELLQDPVGREQFIRFLDKEFSGENLKFWEAVRNLKTLPQKDVEEKVQEIWNEFLAADASCPINVDSRSYEMTKRNLEKPDRWSFDVAAAHVYHLMKSDSYSRYLRSDLYKDFLNVSKKKIGTSVKGIRSIVSFTGRKDTQAV